MVFTLDEFKKSKFSNQKHYFVVGYPIRHSLSPKMHQLALDYHSIDATYHALNLLSHEVSEFTSWVNRDAFLGCNITIPYKEQLAAIADQLDDFAVRTGVINTIAKTDTELIGHNTDIHGFLAPLTQYSDLIEGGRAIVFGTGGASKAVKVALENIGIEEIIFVSRNPYDSQQKSEYTWIKTVGYSEWQAFAEEACLFEKSEYTWIKTVGYSEWQAFAEEACLFVNTTPLGMSPNSDSSPVLDQDSDLLSGKVCYDLVYNPLQTKFLKQAEDSGSVVIEGLDMLIHQGNRSFEIWTGKSFPFDEVKNLLINELSK